MINHEGQRPPVMLTHDERLRMQTIEPGDPVGEYRDFEEVQLALIEEERQRLQPVTDTLQAAERLQQIMSPTRLQYAQQLSSEIGVPVYLKREDETAVHSFKLRGAFNKMAQLTEVEKMRGVLAASAGNHAQGVALSAKLLGIQATIVMPDTAPKLKVDAVESLGATVILSGDSYSEAYDHSQEILKESGQVFIHPFDDPEVIAGQGTVGKEILDQQPDVTHIFVPIGGGGLIAGIAQYSKLSNPSINIIGVEPEDSNAMQAAFKKGRPVELPHVGIFADGVAVKKVGELTFDLAAQYVDNIITVDNDEIAAAVEVFANETRGFLEPAGALAIAGARKHAQAMAKPEDAVFAAICSGANSAFRTLNFITERSEYANSREALFAISLPEEPGSLLELCKQAVNGHNITELKYRLNKRDNAHILLGLSMGSIDDKQRFMQKLSELDYTFSDVSKDPAIKDHIRHMIGGRSELCDREMLYEIEFPERPGALIDFLESLESRWNISLFHYRGIGGDTGRVLIGFEDPDVGELEKLLRTASSQFAALSSEAARLFL